MERDNSLAAVADPALLRSYPNGRPSQHWGVPRPPAVAAASVQYQSAHSNKIYDEERRKRSHVLLPDGGGLDRFTKETGGPAGGAA